MMLKTFALAFVAQLALVASLSPGDCAFVGVYGDQDDFALVMMEDVDGEVLYLTEETPSKHFEVSHSVAAKTRVSNAKRGSVLRKADFEVDPTSFVAPSGLTIFVGSEKFPTPLCSINLESQGGTVARKLTEDVNVVMLGLTDTAQYVGQSSGSKEELLEDISNPKNWQRDGSRKLSAFSIAMKNDTSSTTSSAQQFRSVVSACTELGGDIASLAGSKEAESAFATAIASVLNIPSENVENVVFTPGVSCGARRLESDARRLQTSGTVTYDLVFPPGETSAMQAEAVMQMLETVTVAEVQQAVTQAFSEVDSLKDITVTVVAITATKTEGGGSTVTTSTVPISSSSSGSSSSSTTPSTDEPPDEQDGACYKSLAFGLLVAIAGHVM